MAANASSIWASVVALKTLASWPNVFAAAGTSIPSNLLGGFSGFVSTANVVVLGTRSRNNSSRFAARGDVKKVTPVTLPLGRLRLLTSPGATGSPPIANTIGIDVVAALAASPAGVPLMAAITAT